MPNSRWNDGPVPINLRAEVRNSNEWDVTCLVCGKRLSESYISSMRRSEFDTLELKLVVPKHECVKEPSVAAD